MGVLLHKRESPPKWCVCVCVCVFGGVVSREISEPWNSTEQWPKPWLFCLKGIKPPSYIGIIIGHYKDPYWTSSIMECQQVFFSWLNCKSRFWLAVDHLIILTEFLGFILVSWYCRQDLFPINSMVWLHNYITNFPKVGLVVATTF